MLHVSKAAGTEVNFTQSSAKLLHMALATRPTRSAPFATLRGILAALLLLLLLLPLLLLLLRKL
eukprot:4401523-Amphidinium_carterae.1